MYFILVYVQNAIGSKQCLKTIPFEKKYIFDACIAWAKASCVRNSQDSLDDSDDSNDVSSIFYKIQKNQNALIHFKH